MSSVSLNNLKKDANAASQKLKELKATYSNTLSGNGLIGVKSKELVVLLNDLNTNYGTKSLELSDTIAEIAADAVAASSLPAGSDGPKN